MRAIGNKHWIFRTVANFRIKEINFPGILTVAGNSAVPLYFASSSHDFNPVTGRAKAAVSDQAGVPALRKRS